MRKKNSLDPYEYRNFISRECDHGAVMKETAAADLSAFLCFSRQNTGEMKASVTEMKYCNYEGTDRHRRQMLQPLKDLTSAIEAA